MNSARRDGMIVLSGIWLAGLTACSGVLMNTPAARRADGWNITLSQIKEGPDTYPAGGLDLGPAKGEAFLWALVTVRNEQEEERTFSYEDCTLDAKGRTYKPVVVDRHMDVPSSGETEESFPPGQERTRSLIFSYPKDARPTRMKCGPIAIPVPPKR